MAVLLITLENEPQWLRNYIKSQAIDKHGVGQVRLRTLLRNYFSVSTILNSTGFCKLPQYETLHWRHNERDGVSNHQPYDCLLKRLFRHSSKKTSKLRVTGLCEGNSPVTDELFAQRASNTENVSIWWRHHGVCTVACRVLKSGNKSHDPRNCVLNEPRFAIPEVCCPCLYYKSRCILW